MASNKTKKLNIITKKLSPRKAKKGVKKGAPRTKKVSPWIVLGAVAALLLATTLPYFRGAGERGAAVPHGAREFCLDLSHHNSAPARWDSLFVAVDQGGRTVRNLEAASEIYPVRRVVLKATEGLSMVDKDFPERWEAAGKAGLCRGAYHFFRSSKDPAVQAELFIRTVGPLRHSDLPPVLDIETLHSGCTGEVLSSRALLWLKAVERHYGRKPVVYAPESYLRDLLSKEITGNYPVWIAHYEVDAPEREGWIMWQFTDRAVVAGLPGRADLSAIGN